MHDDQWAADGATAIRCRIGDRKSKLEDAFGEGFMWNHQRFWSRALAILCACLAVACDSFSLPTDPAPATESTDTSTILEIIQPADAAIVGDVLRVQMPASMAAVGAENSAAIDSVSIALDGAAALSQNVGKVQVSVIQLEFSLSGLSEGSHSCVITALGGTQSRQITRKITLDRTPPKLKSKRPRRPR